MSNKAGHQARKRFGQNFLHDPGTIERIIRAINPKPDDAIVEIGPGLGALTEEILAVNPRLQVVELDRDLIPVLRTKFFNYPEFRIHEADALKFDFSQLMVDPLRIIGNLPYNIHAPDFPPAVPGRRGAGHALHAAKRGGSEDGRGARRQQLRSPWHHDPVFLQVQPLFEVGPGAFRPAPKVDSAIVRLVPHKTLPHPANLATLQAVVRTAFNARRKTLRKALGGMVSVEQLQSLGINDGLRPENLGLADYVAIADLLFEEKGPPAPQTR